MNRLQVREAARIRFRHDAHGAIGSGVYPIEKTQ